MTGRRLLALVLVGLGTAVVPLDTAVNIAFPDITRSFGLPIAMIQWVVICYVLTYASLMLACGRAGDVFSHDRVFRLGLLWSTAAFLLCAAAPSYPFLLFFRFLQGIGAGLVISVAPALVTGFFPEERRSRALGVFTMMFALGSALGPLLGGALVHAWGWPAVFWFRAPIAFLALFFPDGRPAAARAAKREPLDVAGAVLLALALSTALLAINQAQRLGGGDYAALPLGAAALAGLVLFLRRESRVAQPIVNLEFFRNLGFSLINLANVLVSLTSFAVMLFAPYYLVRLTGLSLPAAGAVLAASPAGMVVASPLAGRIVERIAAERVAAVGAVMAGAGLFLIAIWTPGRPETALILGILLLQGLGTGLFQVSYIEVVMRTLPRRQRGVAGSLAMLTRTIGTVSGATLLTLVFDLAEDGVHGQTGFLAGFRATFRLAGLVCAASGALAVLGRPALARTRRAGTSE
ncbi:MAG TPA: MFS transporter [Stellaceae bacterium]|nr:MFS transporter [Stellaceae bacterium]